ncbi:unnamed protein product [Cylicostephanus goldi]|uniref:ubiquitinyl hydrolase 1 n=1 Tax=Cylicostephanus goldi TaxID=71465 RepID=A0A3P7MSD0_CYLGO|nr:unnamed protein product [Cylicostephanus goldi]
MAALLMVTSTMHPSSSCFCWVLCNEKKSRPFLNCRTLHAVNSRQHLRKLVSFQSNYPFMQLATLWSTASVVISHKRYWVTVNGIAQGVAKRASRMTKLWSLPPVVVVHLKRFSMENGDYAKNTMPVDFDPSRLDLSEYLHENSPEIAEPYRLYAVTNHYG